MRHERSRDEPVFLSCPMPHASCPHTGMVKLTAMFELNTNKRPYQYRRILFMSKRIIVMTLAMAVSAGTLFAQEAAKSTATADAKQAASPRLTIVEPVKDFGVVPKGDKLDWTFVIKNTGDSDL